MARSETIKTALGQRFRDIRKSLGDPTREAFAGIMGIHPNSLANYERGDRIPDAAVLMVYREKYNVNLDWLVTGRGEMFLPDAPSAQAAAKSDKIPGIDQALFKRINRRLGALYKEGKIDLRHDDLISETVRRYNELLDDGADLKDDDEINLRLQLMEKKVRREIEAAHNEPGTGKLSA